MSALRFGRFLFHRYTRRTLIILFVAWCAIFVTTTIIFPLSRQWTYRKSHSDVSVPLRLDGSQWTSSNVVDTVSNASGVLERRKGLNLHLWSVTGFEVKSLKQWHLFPCFPVRKGFAPSFSVEVNEKDIGQRVFGFLIPQTSGTYQFAITSDDDSELWLSTSEDPSDVQLIAKVHDNYSFAWTKPGEYKKYPGQISAEISLRAGQKYFIEGLHKNGVGIGHVLVLWKAAGSEEFILITGQYLAPFCMKDNVNCMCKNGTVLLNIPSYFEPTSQAWAKYFQYYFNTSFLHVHDLKNVLPLSSYDPSYIVKDGIVKDNKGIYFSLEHKTAVYPKDATEIERGTSFLNSVSEFCPNQVLPKEEAEGVVLQFLGAIARHYDKRFALKKIVAVEGKNDSHVARYFLELELHDAEENRRARFAEYVLRDNSGGLSLPDGLTWNRNAVVHFIVPIKNQAKWMTFLVSELSTLYGLTKDENFRLVVTDFESTDGDIERILKESPLSQKYTLVKKSGAFHKTLAIQDSVKTVTDPDSIVFLFDLHITVPRTFLDTIRKHTVQGKMVFLPIVARLEDGRTPENPKGRWEELGSGLVAVYKSDWDRFHGMDVEKFKTKWGGEDWNLLDRMLRVGLESERFKLPGLYHYHHSKRQMWDKTR